MAASDQGQDCSAALLEQVRQSIAAQTAIKICGSGSKSFYGHPVDGQPLNTTGHRGIVNYQPSELVITARAGTPLHDIHRALDDANQSLMFEPPSFGPNATLGGTIACGLSGPGRIAYGASRDFVLGTKVINGRGEILRFGGEVMKNVAGYDLSRLLTGAMGTLGLLLEVSLKTLPKPEHVAHLVFEFDEAAAVEQIAQWAGQPWPISASCIYRDQLHIRLSGNHADVSQCAAQLGGDAHAKPDFWDQLREQQHGFFDDPRPLWRLSVPPATPPLNLEGDSLIEWHGGQRWLLSDQSAEQIRQHTAAAGGHATLFRTAMDTATPRFHPLSKGLFKVHQRLKQSMDPQGLFNPGKLYQGL